MQRPLPIEADMFLYAAGRNGNNADLACDEAGLYPDERETLKVDEIYRSAVPHICAAGDVIAYGQIIHPAYWAVGILPLV